MQYSFWFTSLTLLHVSSNLLPCVFSRCQGIDKISLAVHPEGLIKVPHGQALEIFCQDDKYTADNIEFGLEGVHVSSVKVNTTTRKLFVENPKRGLYAYYCRNNITKKACPTRVLVDSAPMDVTDFKCKSKNLDILNCTWVYSESISPTNFSLNFLPGYDHSENVCMARHSRIIRYCAWNSSSVPRYRQINEQFTFHLKFCNVFGCNEQNFTIDHFSIVKPDPPSQLKVLGNGTHSVYLQWNIPNNMVYLLPNGVDHKIEYQIAKIDNTSYFRTVNTTGLPAKNKTYELLLSDLPYAHMQYDLRIYIKTKEAFKDEFWSDFTYLVFYTASEKPKRPPDTVVGAFDQNPFETTRRINVYWKQLEEYEEAGANFTYKVVVRQDTGNPKTLLADNKKSLSYIVLDASLGAINVDVWSTNDKGSSHNKSNLYIPPNTDTVALKIPSFTKLAYENGTYKLSWVEKKNIDNYTLFWCLHNTPKVCTSRINFTVLEPNKTNYAIDLPKENIYQFAISANNGTKTSGMVWATDCPISKHGIPIHGFPIQLEHGIPGNTFVQIKWNTVCTLQGIITGYNITYCPIKHTSGKCDPSFAESTVNISDPNQMEVNITDLKPYRTYQFTIGLNTTYGSKRIKYAFTEVTTIEDTPTSPINVEITDVKIDSVVISWDPPLDKHGIVKKYVIYNYTKEYAFVEVSASDKDDVRRSFKLKGINGFSNYLWSIAACNSAVKSCSQKSSTIFFKTRLNPPSKVTSLKILSDSKDFIKWERHGGAVEFYQILRIQNGKQDIVFNTTDSSYSLDNNCEDATEEKYQVRAVNSKGYIEYNNVTTNTIRRYVPKHIEYLASEWSDPISVECTSNSVHTTIFITVAVIAFVACMIVIIYELIKFYKRRHTAK